jgi:transcriptional regulator with XRE-family HTH domain
MAETEAGYGTVDFAGALGHTIKVLRTDRGIERKDLADRARISYSHLASIEAGQKQPSPQVLTAIAEALGMASHELLESVEYRRRRNLRPNSDPWWLTGDAALPAPAATVAAPARAARQEFRAGSQSRDSGDLAAFVAEITELAARMGPKERLLLLDTARKFAEGYPGA